MEPGGDQTPEFGTQDLQTMSLEALFLFGKNSANAQTSELVIHEYERRTLADCDEQTTIDVTFGLIVAHDRLLKLKSFEGPWYDSDPIAE